MAAWLNPSSAQETRVDFKAPRFFYILGLCSRLLAIYRGNFLN